MKACILTEAGGNYGFGHLVRCDALAQGLDEEDIDVEFLINGDVPDGLMGRSHTYTVVDWCISDHQAMYESDIIVIDSYTASAKRYAEICRNARQRIFFDDTMRMEYPSGFIVNGAIGAENLRYAEGGDHVHLLGTSYQVLRKPFWNIPEYRVSPVIDSFLITFGGSDVANMTPGMLASLAGQFPRRTKHVLMGSGFQNRHEVLAACDDYTEIHHNVSAEEIVQIMTHVDLAISASGQTLYELARIGVPTIGIMVAENQRHNTDMWKKKGFLLPSSNFDPSCQDRRNSSDSGKQAIDGSGVTRILQRLMHR